MAHTRAWYFFAIAFLFSSSGLCGAATAEKVAVPVTVSVEGRAGGMDGIALSALSDDSPAEVMEGRRGGSLEKSLANGVYMSGAWAASWVGTAASVTLANIYNDSYTRTTGTLRLELWAVTTIPARAGGFTGYKLAAFGTLSPLAPRTHYTNVSGAGTMSYPPNGTYWLLLVLTEFDSSCTSRSDNFCQQDNVPSISQQTFGASAPTAPSLGVSAKSVGSRGTVTSGATLYGGFELASSSKIYILVRGNSLGSLGVTQSFLDAPRVRLYNSQGTDLVSQAGFPGFNFCLASNTVTDYPVLLYYQNRGVPVDSRDACYTTSLAAGAYTFTVTPSFGGSNSGVSSSNIAGEVLFEVTLAKP